MTRQYEPPAYVQENRELREAARAPRPCGEGIGGGRICGGLPAALYTRGYRCADCARRTGLRLPDEKTAA